MNTTTIRDLLRLVLPPGSALATAAHGLHQHVGPAASLRATLPAFPQLRGGELALVGVAQARLLDERLTLPNIVRRLADVPVGAIAVDGSIDDAARAVADAADLPLLQLPPGTDLRRIERDVQQLLLDPDLQHERRAAQLYTELTQHVAAGDGMDSLLRVLAERTGRAVALLSANGTTRSGRGPRHLSTVFDNLRLPVLPTQTVLGFAVRTHGIDSSGVRLGYVALADETLDRWDELALAQAAAACALELAKQQAVQAAEARVRGDVLRTILSGTITDPQLLQQQAAEWGYDLARPHCALVIVGDDPHTPVERLQHDLRRVLERQQVRAPTLVRDERVVCFCPSDDEYTQPFAVLRALTDLHAVAAGMSTPAATTGTWPRAHDEAEQALVLGQQLFGPHSITAYSDLGVYRLLLQLRGSTELRGFYHQTLGALVAHDRGNGGELVRTLEGYFAALGNVHQAAELLHVHRNTLIYRLRRIGEISGLNLKRAEDVLSLQLALRIHRIFTAVGDER